MERDPYFHVPGGHSYFPNRGQLPFHLDRDVLFRLLSGGTGSGKTLAGVAEDLDWCIRYPGIVGYIFEPVYKMIDRVIIPTLNWFLGVPFYENRVISAGGGFHRGRMNIRFWNGSVLWLGSLDDPEMAEGANVDFIHVDEARLVPKFETAWKVIQRRLRGSGGGHPVGAWVTTTPNQPGSALWKFFEGPKTKSPNAQVYRLHIDDNKDNLTEDWIEGIKREHSGALYKRFVEGLFAGEERATFDFDYSIHVDGFKKPKYGDIAYGVDFGWTEETCILAVLFDNDRRVFVLDEIYENRLSDANISDRCYGMQGKWGKGTFWCDPAAPDTINYLKREGLKVKPGNRNRDEGIREIGGRMKDAGDGRHRLYVSDNCINLIDELQIYNEERKGHDHAVDALRYCLLGGKRKREAAFAFGPKRRW